MYEYEIMNKKTNEINFIFGTLSATSVMKKYNLDPTEWVVISREYID